MHSMFRQRRFLGLIRIAIILMMIAHFSITGIYVLRQLPVPEVVRIWTDIYSAPLFHQNWKLFAPDVPEYNTELEFRNYKNGAWSNWSDVSLANGYAVPSPIETIEQSICTSLAWQVSHNFYTKDTRQQFDRIVASFDYGRAIYFAHALYERTHGEATGDSLQLRLAFRFHPKMDAARTLQHSYLEFPVYDMSNARIAK